MSDLTSQATPGITDPEQVSKALTELGNYTNPQRMALAQRAQQVLGGSSSEPQTFEELWAAKYGDPVAAQNVRGITTADSGGNEIFPLPSNTPLTVRNPDGSEQYNPAIGEVIGFSPDGQVMTTKTHPYLAGLVAHDSSRGGA